MLKLRVSIKGGPLSRAGLFQGFTVYYLFFLIFQRVGTQCIIFLRFDFLHSTFVVKGHIRNQTLFFQMFYPSLSIFEVFKGVNSKQQTKFQKTDHLPLMFEIQTLIVLNCLIFHANIVRYVSDVLAVLVQNRRKIVG